MGNASSQAPLEENELIKAAKKGESDRIIELLKNNEDINVRDNDSSTSLMWASANGHENCVKILLEKKANLEDRDKDGYTALHWAVIQKHLPIVQLLLKYNANIEAKNNQGDTPLHKAIYYNSKEIASTLIHNNANVNSLNNMQQTPFDKARNKDLKLWLKSLGAKTNKEDPQLEGEKDEALKQNKDNNPILSDNDQEYLSRSKMKNDVESWLRSLLLPEYIDRFISNGYDRFDAIYEINENDLVNIGVKMGHVKIILRSIEQIKLNNANKVDASINNDNKKEEHQNIDEPGNGKDDKVDNIKNENINNKNDNNNEINNPGNQELEKKVL